MKDVIIIPTCDERDNIKVLVPFIFNILPKIEVMVTDNLSADGTADVVKELQKQYKNLSLFPRNPRNGLGTAYINAFREVLKDRDVRSIIMMDADFTSQLKSLPDMIEKSKDYSVVIGSRYVKGSEIIGWQLWRRVLSFFGNLYCRIILRMPIHDYTCGYNVINAGLLRKIDLSKMDSTGYAFILELKYILYKAGATFYEVPIVFMDRVGGESKISSHIIGEGIVAPWKMIMRKNKNIKNNSMVKDVVCVGCLSNSSSLFGKKGNFYYTQCSVCKMLSLYNKSDSLDLVYDAEYFSGGGGGFGYVNYDEDKIPMIDSFKKYLDLIERKLGGKGKLLDVGAATGFFMNLAKDAGFKVSGVEYSDFAAKKGRDSGLDIVTGTLNNVDYISGDFDVVTLFDVAEHLPDPELDIKIVQKMLRKDGLIVINTPDSGSLVAKLLGMRWHLIVPPEHIYLFNKKGLSLLLERNGFEVVLVTRMSKKFTLEYVCHMLFKWLKIGFFQKIAIKLKGTSIGKISLPTDFRDNMIIVARKK